MVEKIKIIPEKLPRKKQKRWGKRFTGYPKGKGFGKKAGGKVMKKHTGGRLGRMGEAGLSPAEMDRAGVMSEKDRLRYMKKGSKVGKKKGGTVNRKHGSQVGTAFVANQYAPRKR